MPPLLLTRIAPAVAELPSPLAKRNLCRSMVPVVSEKSKRPPDFKTTLPCTESVRVSSSACESLLSAKLKARYLTPPSRNFVKLELLICKVALISVTLSVPVISLPASTKIAPDVLPVAEATKVALSVTIKRPSEPIPMAPPNWVNELSSKGDCH